MNLHPGKRVALLPAIILSMLLLLPASCGGRGEGAGDPEPGSSNPYGLYAPGTLEELNPEIGQIIIDGLGLDDIAQYQDYTIGRVNDLGISWVRIDLIYSQLGFFVPSDYLEKLYGDGLSVIGCIRPVTDLDLQNLSGFQQDVRELVSGNPSITTWQIDNEPGLGNNYTPEQYLQIFFSTRAAVKDACPSCMIVLAGSAVPFEDGTRELEFYNAVFAGIASASPGERLFDAIDLHIYGRAGKYRIMAAMVEDYRNLLEKNGFDPADIEVWMTECATYTGHPVTPWDYPPQTEEQQAAELLKRFTVMIEAGADRVAWSRIYENYRYARIDNGYFDNVGLIYNGIGTESGAGVQAGVPKKAFSAYRTLIGQTDGFSEVERIAPGQYRFEFADGRDPVYVLWSEDGTAVPPELEGGVLLTDFEGNESEADGLTLEYMPVFARKA